MLSSNLMKIEVIGTGCAKCDTTEKMAKEAVSKTGVDVQVVKVSDRIGDRKIRRAHGTGPLIDDQVKVAAGFLTLRMIKAGSMQ